MDLLVRVHSHQHRYRSEVKALMLHHTEQSKWILKPGSSKVKYLIKSRATSTRSSRWPGDTLFPFLSWVAFLTINSIPSGISFVTLLSLFQITIQLFKSLFWHFLLIRTHVISLRSFWSFRRFYMLQNFGVITAAPKEWRCALVQASELSRLILRIDTLSLNLNQ